MPTSRLAEIVERFVRQPVAGLVERLLPGEHFLPNNLPLAAVGLGDRGVEHVLARPPDIRPGAVAFDEGNDRPIGHHEPSLLLLELPDRRLRWT